MPYVYLNGHLVWMLSSRHLLT